MNKPSKYQILKNAFDLIGILAILISLILVLQELKQSKQIALSDFDMTFTQNRILRNQFLAEHADIWLRGAADDSLSETETLIFQRLVEIENDLNFYKITQADRLGDVASREVLLADFVDFLHRNPGVRRVWVERETNFFRARQALGSPALSDIWYGPIQAKLEYLDKRGE